MNPVVTEYNKGILKLFLALMLCEIRNIAVSPEDILYSLENGYVFKRPILVAPCGLSGVSFDGY